MPLMVTGLPPTICGSIFNEDCCGGVEVIIGIVKTHHLNEILFDNFQYHTINFLEYISIVRDFNILI